MAQAHDTKQILYQNLIDAECGEKLTKECMEFSEAGMNKIILQNLHGELAKYGNNILLGG